MAETSGGSDTYESSDELAPNAVGALPNAPNPAVVAARALLAWAFAVRFDMAGVA